MLIAPFDTLDPKHIRRVHHHKGDVVFRQGSAPFALFLVLSGQVNLHRTTPAGHSVTLHRARPGTVFAEASLYSDSYHCDATCTLSGTLIVIDKPAVLARMAQTPAFAMALNRRLALQVQTYRQMLEILAIRSANERTLAAVTAGYLTGPVTELASQICLTHEACYRALRHLCNRGLLVQTGRGKYAAAPPDRPAP